jgi:hypothetical protein
MSPALKRSFWLAGALGLLAAGASQASTSGAGQGPTSPSASATPPATETVPPGAGRVVLSCLVLADRSVGRCQVAREAPAGHGLGEAALRMSREIRIPTESFTADMVGETVEIPLSFALEEADASDMPIDMPPGR